LISDLLLLLLLLLLVLVVLFGEGLAQVPGEQAGGEKGVDAGGGVAGGGGRRRHDGRRVAGHAGHGGQRGGHSLEGEGGVAGVQACAQIHRCWLGGRIHRALAALGGLRTLRTSNTRNADISTRLNHHCAIFLWDLN
jgi:hypothetical protein